MILDMASDDYTGLWEFVWGRCAKSEDESESHVIDDVGKALRPLIESSRVALYRGSHFSGEETRLETSEALTALADSQVWEPPAPGSEHLRVLAP
jgi:hypothetical protein